jgi:hypothetical protein
VITAEPKARSLSQLVGQLILVLIVILATIEATSLLHFTAVATLLGAFLVLVGQVSLGLLVLAVGLYLASVPGEVVAVGGAFGTGGRGAADDLIADRRGRGPDRGPAWPSARSGTGPAVRCGLRRAGHDIEASQRSSRPRITSSSTAPCVSTTISS